MTTKKTHITTKQDDKLKEVAIGTGVVLLFLFGLSKLGAAQTLKYSCSGEPDYICNQNIDGIYNTVEECQTSCTPQFITVDVIVNE